MVAVVKWLQYGGPGVWISSFRSTREVWELGTRVSTRISRKKKCVGEIPNLQFSYTSLFFDYLHTRAKAYPFTQAITSIWASPLSHPYPHPHFPIAFPPLNLAPFRNHHQSQSTPTSNLHKVLDAIPINMHYEQTHNCGAKQFYALSHSHTHKTRLEIGQSSHAPLVPRRSLKPYNMHRHAKANADMWKTKGGGGCVPSRITRCNDKQSRVRVQDDFLCAVWDCE